MHKKALLGRPDAFDVAKIPYARFGRCTVKGTGRFGVPSARQDNGIGFSGLGLSRAQFLVVVHKRSVRSCISICIVR